VDKLTAGEAYLAGKLALPPGYGVEMDADLMELRRPDGSLVAVFSTGGAAPAAVLRVAEEDYRRYGRSSA
jgi:hypothetical protein